MTSDSGLFDEMFGADGGVRQPYQEYRDWFDVRIVKIVQKELHYDNIKRFVTEFKSVVQEHSWAVLNLEEVEYLDSAGLGALVQLFLDMEKRGGGIYLVGVKGRLQALFKITRLSTVFKFFPDEKGALAELMKRT